MTPALKVEENPDHRIALIALLAIAVGLSGGLAAAVLTALIRLITHLAFEGRVALTPIDPATTQLGGAVMLIPVAGALVVGMMARWGSEAIRGHGIPEVMDRVLHADSRIPAKLTILKPLSAAIAIGTGGPFGSEGPIIATGGALGSLLGQVTHVTADERKTLLAAGAAAGMAATFGAPVAAVLLAIELLLFEFRASSIVPVALAACAATSVRLILLGNAPIYPMPEVLEPGGVALICYAVLGGVIGAISVGITRSLFAVEDLFERLPLHWMWWPVVGAVVVGIAGYLDPRILGVGPENIINSLAGRLTIGGTAGLILLKFLAWVSYLGSGTSGGTLAPLFTFGSGLGAIAGAATAAAFPELGIAPPVAALVGMAAMFAGASRALLTSVVFAFEVTRQPLGLLPLLAGCTTAFLISRLLMRHSIMTEKLARRGVLVQDEYAVDFLSRLPVAGAMTTEVQTLCTEDSIAAAATTGAHPATSGHQAFPVVDALGGLVGVVTMRDLRRGGTIGRVGDLVRRQPVTAFPDQSLRDAADIMVREGVGRLAVVSRSNPRQLVGILSRSDLLRAHAPRLHAAEVRHQHMALDQLARDVFRRQ